METRWAHTRGSSLCQSPDVEYVPCFSHKRDVTTVMQIQIRVLQANDVPRGLEGLDNMLPFPDIPPQAHPEKRGYGFIHPFPAMTMNYLEPWTASFLQGPLWEEGLCLQSCSLISSRWSLCDSNHNHHLAYNLEAKENHSQWDKPELPWLDAVPSLHVLVPFSALLTLSGAWISKSLRNPQPWLIAGVRTLEQSWYLPCLRLCFLTSHSSTLYWVLLSSIVHASLNQHGLRTVKFPQLHFPKGLYPVAGADMGLQPHTSILDTAEEIKNLREISQQHRRKPDITVFLHQSFLVYFS